MKAISDTLMHFLGRASKNEPLRQLEIFKKIIQNGLLCSYVETLFGFEGIVNNKAVCFTDMPLNFCDEHAATYGKFAIGFKKPFVKNVGGNPAFYFVDYPVTFKLTPELIGTRGLVFNNLKEVFKFLLRLQTVNGTSDFDGLYDKDGNKLFDQSEIETWLSNSIQVLSFGKPVGDLGPARDEADNIDPYYNEREWRVIPYYASLIRKKIEEINGDYYVKFNRDDVRIIIVPNDDIKNMLIEYLLGLKNEEDLRLREFGQNLPPIINYDELKHF